MRQGRGGRGKGGEQHPGSAATLHVGVPARNLRWRPGCPHGVGEVRPTPDAHDGALSTH